MTCIYCGCTDKNACQLKTADLHPVDQEMIETDNDGILPDVIGCWWIDDDPPVCCAPPCQAKYLAEERV